jgi:hypothetical protein
MAEEFFPFDDGQGADSREDRWRLMAQHWLDTGVLLSVGNRLEVFADNTGLQVKVRTGAAWIVGHYYESDAEKTLPIATPDATNPRIDRVVVRADFVANTITTVVLQGTAGASPTEPPVTNNTAQHEISLALVTVDPQPSASIVAGKVADDRSVVASFGDRFDPGPVTTPPSAYPLGVTIGLVSTADGWPVNGTLTTHKRGGARMWQEVVRADAALGSVERYFRQATYSGAVNGFSPWQRVDWRIHTQTIDLPSIPANSVTTVDVATPAGTLPSAVDRVVYGAGLASFGLLMQGVNVVAAETIRLRIVNFTGAAIDQAATSFQFVIFGRYI